MDNLSSQRLIACRSHPSFRVHLVIGYISVRVLILDSVFLVIYFQQFCLCNPLYRKTMIYLVFFINERCMPTYNILTFIFHILPARRHSSAPVQPLSINQPDRSARPAPRASNWGTSPTTQPTCPRAPCCSPWKTVRATSP